MNKDTAACVAASVTEHGSPEHFQQVVNAHTVSPWGHCRCGASVGTADSQYRAHIARVWHPFDLPERW